MSPKVRVGAVRLHPSSMQPKSYSIKNCHVAILFYFFKRLFYWFNFFICIAILEGGAGVEFIDCRWRVIELIMAWGKLSHFLWRDVVVAQDCIHQKLLHASSLVNVPWILEISSEQASSSVEATKWIKNGSPFASLMFIVVEMKPL